MLYADDLTLTANDPIQLQKKLRRLSGIVCCGGGVLQYPVLKWLLLLNWCGELFFTACVFFSIYAVKEFVFCKRVSDWPHAMLWLYKTSANWCVLQKSVQEPLQFCWVRLISCHILEQDVWFNYISKQTTLSNNSHKPKSTTPSSPSEARPSLLTSSTPCQSPTAQKPSSIQRDHHDRCRCFSPYQRSNALLQHPRRQAKKYHK